MRVISRKREGRPAALAVTAFSLAVTAFLASAQSNQPDVALLRGVESCQPCHREIIDSYIRTAHFKASRPADASSIEGDFSEGRNLLRTRVAGIYFQMEKRAESFYQTGFEKGGARTERFDLVIGSGRRGQSYLYWKGGLLFQLPVSYYEGTGDWINSPGYEDGKVYFDRLILPKCLECHSTYFHLDGSFPDAKYARDYVLGIACQKCHSVAKTHRDIRNPARFSRDRKMDLCALCHSGIRDPKKPPFTYKPGEDLNDYLMPESGQDHSMPDVHGNQVGLLRRSKCFISSPEMSCSTCHDVHKQERNLAQLSPKCIQCHPPAACKLAAKVRARIAGHCVDCHMPALKSNVIGINTATKKFFQLYRTHAIGIYPQAAQAYLHSLEPKHN